jgi:outer membrane protein assembly factor BamB
MAVFKYLYLVVAILVLGCSNQEVIAPSYMNPSEKIWEYPFSDTLFSGTYKPIILNDRIICSKANLTSYRGPLFALDKQTGKLIWYWQEHIENGNFFIGNWNHHLYENTLVIETVKTVYGFDVNLGKITWSHANKNQFLTGLEDLFFDTTESPEESSVVIGSVVSGNTETIYTEYAEGEFRPFLRPPSVYINAFDEVVLIFQLVMFSYDLGGKPYLVGYNLTKKELEFRTLLDSNYVNGGSRQSPVIYDNKAYFVIDNRVLCVSTETGYIYWDKLVGTNRAGGFVKVANDRVYVMLEERKIIALDPITGERLWLTPTKGGGTDFIEEYKGNIYFVTWGDAKLYCLDGATGEIRYIWKSPREEQLSGAFFQIQFSIDKEEGLLFISDHVYINCYRMPE